MLVREFLAIVLPPINHGFYCGVELTSKVKEHVFVSNTEDLAERTLAFDNEGKDAYFAVATFAKNTNRTAANSEHIRCLFMDIDAGADKPYISAKAALAAVAQWCTDTGFPTPYVIHSGGGLHCYWPFEEPVAITRWKPVADQLKNCCLSKGLRIDFSVSADAARVLRVPTTHNRKRVPIRSVEIKVEGEIKSFDTYARLLESYADKKSTLAEVKPNFDPILDEAPTFAVENASYRTDLQEVSQHNFDAIVAMGDEGCLQIQHYINNAPKEGMEPLWRGVMSVAKYCIDGEDKAKWLASLHPYEDARTLKKLHEIKGPYNCETFNKTEPSICTKCKHFGKLTNPIQLGSELKPPPVVVAPVIALVAAPVAPSQYPTPPDGYAINDKGVWVQYSDENGVPRITPITDTPLYATATYDRAGERYIQFTYKEHGTLKSTIVPLTITASRDDAIKAFARVGIMVMAGRDAEFRTYLKNSISQAKKLPPMRMPTSLGWQEDDSFAFDSRIFSTTGEHEVPMYGFDNVVETMGVKGTLDGWRLVIAGVIRMERWDILAMMSVGFAAPLMKFTGLNGITFHLCGNDSGRGKTLCQRLASSIWGVPDKFRVSPNTSPIAMINRLGLLGNLPLLVDEITHKGRAEAEWFPDFLSQMSDGRGKDRMEAQTNMERRNTTTWSTLALMTSNKHMMDYLTAERSHGSEGEIRRLIEITFDREFNADELTKSLLFDMLPQNYGVAGEAYVKWLVNNVDVARTLTKNTYAEVFKNFNATGDERFWVAGCACILASIRIVGSNYAGIVEIPIGKIAAFLLKTIEEMRNESRRMRRTAMDVLNEFTKRNFGKLVTVNGRMARIAGIEVAETLDRRDLCGRVEKGLEEGMIDYFIEERELKSFCSSLSYGYTEFNRDIILNKECEVEYIRKNLLQGTKGPAMSVRCIHIKQKMQGALEIFGDKAANG
jgi:hypothetical protein